MANFRDGLSLIPQHMHGGVVRYVERGTPPGSFLMALLSNDFMGAMGRADDDNRAAIHDWANFIWNHMPSDSHGSPEKVRAWMVRGGLSAVAVENEAAS